MIDCTVCGKPFDNEHWFLGQSPEGEPELTVVRRLMRCPECWKKLKERSHCHISFGNESDFPEDLKKWRVS